MSEQMSEQMSGRSTRDTGRAARRGVDPFALIVGLIALFMATLPFSGTGWLSGVDARWLVAAGAMLVGLLLLVGTVRKPRR